MRVYVGNETRKIEKSRWIAMGEKEGEEEEEGGGDD